MQFFFCQDAPEIRDNIIAKLSRAVHAQPLHSSAHSLEKNTGNTGQMCSLEKKMELDSSDQPAPSCWLAWEKLFLLENAITSYT